MKKKRLSVRIDGVWYRVAHGGLHKIRRSGSGHAGGSSSLRQAAQAYCQDPSSHVADEVLDQTSSLGGEDPHSEKAETSSSVEGACSFVHGRPPSESSEELGDSCEKEYESEESCMSTATSARRKPPLIIKIRLSKDN